MTDRIARGCQPRKSNPHRILSAAFCFLGLTLLFGSSGANAQTSEQGIGATKSVSLPRPFAQFSAADVLKQITSSYDPATGRMSRILNEDGKPAIVQIEEAKPWKAQGQDHLVVLISVSEEDNPSGLCGGCLMNGFLAVLKKNGNALSLVAKQLTLPASGAVKYESLNQDELITITGHDNVALDLAPYRLNDRETLIGFRLEHIWLPTSDWSTSLSLYLIEAGRLKEVFRELVVERVYPTDPDRGSKAGPRVVDKTTSTISFVPASHPTRNGFNDLVIRKTTARCLNKDDDCTPKHDGFRETGTQTELWKFDGLRYVQATPRKH